MKAIAFLCLTKKGGINFPQNQALELNICEGEDFLIYNLIIFNVGDLPFCEEIITADFLETVPK